MKKNFFISVVVLLNVIIVNSQPVKVKLYGYIQQIIPGASLKRDMYENGKQRELREDKKYNYLIYLMAPKSTPIQPIEIRIRGKAYSFKTDTVRETPVTYVNYNIPNQPKTQILVPKTDKAVFLLSPLPALSEKHPYTLGTKAKSNELLVLYKIHGKVQMAFLKKMVMLEPVAYQ